MSVKDEVLRRLAEKQRLAQEAKKNGDDVKTETDYDQLVADFEADFKQLIDQQVQEKLDAMPIHRQPGEAIAMDTAADDLNGNRYQRIAKNIARDGFHKTANRKLKAVDLALAQKLLNYAHQIEPGRYAVPSDDLKAAVKALDTSTSGAGSELTDTQTMQQLWDDFYLSSLVVSNMQTIDPMPSDPFNIPLGLGDVTWRKASQNVAVSATNVSTAESVLTTTELVAEVNWSYSLDEDSVVAFLPALRARLAISGGEIMDDFALNADATATATGNVNLDDDTPPSDSYYLSDGQDGIRHQWIVDNTSQTVNAGGDALADADIVSMLGNMDKYAVDPQRVIQVCDVSTYLAGYLNLDTVVTIDKFGPGATVLTGQLAAYRGIPIIVSVSHRLAQADGKLSTTAANNTLGSISAFNTLMWYAGMKRDMLIEVDRDIRTRKFILVASFREAVAAHGTRSSNTHTAGVRNILV